ncbi:MAG TPA: hypothetical protein VGI46_02030 [Candidatus Acidoferrum sp.]|jgi:hypothetical protein
MDEYQESNENGKGWADAARAGANRWLVVGVVALLVITAVTFGYGYHQQALVRQRSEQSAAANTTTNQLQGQVAALTAKLNEMTAAQTPPSASPSATPAASPAAEPATEVSAQTSEAPSAPAAPPKHAPAKRPAAKRHAPVDKKYAQLQAQLAEQQNQLKATQDEVEKNRADLEGNINSTRDDLNGSIAKTHEELVALEKRGERSYFEFDLSKSKQFQRIGPLSLALRKADTKHKSYDLAMVVDDNELNKKKVNLYEPIWIHTENDSQPVQIIVNKIDKDTVHGYISAPKYKPSELAAAGSASVAPASAKTPVSTPNPPNPEQPQQPQQ